VQLDQEGSRCLGDVGEGGGEQGSKACPVSSTVQGHIRPGRGYCVQAQHTLTT
jgi:hypothetical protein